MRKPWLPRRGSIAALAVLVAGLSPVDAACQTPTRLLVRAVAHDAKVISTGVGGARITVRDAATGEVLAQGVQEGSTGNTRSIASEPRVRGATVFDTPGTAGFMATLDLREPTLVDVEAEGPLGSPEAMQRARTTLLMVPGVDVVGEGLVIELHGFTVQILSAEADSDGSVDVRVRVTMLCGCPIEPGGLWDADRLSVTARLLRDRTVVTESRLGFAGETSTFAGVVEGAAPGRYDLQILAMDAPRANAGMASQTVTIPR